MKEWVKKFYESKAWKDTREYVISECHGICEKCNERSAEIVHHIIWLTPSNINNVDITLKRSNLQAVCRECHGKIHEGVSSTVDGLVFNDRGELVNED